MTTIGSIVLRDLAELSQRFSVCSHTIRFRLLCAQDKYPFLETLDHYVKRWIFLCDSGNLTDARR